MGEAENVGIGIHSRDDDRKLALSCPSRYRARNIGGACPQIKDAPGRFPPRTDELLQVLKHQPMPPGASVHLFQDAQFLPEQCLIETGLVDQFRVIRAEAPARCN
jgi:hypothetical protein